MTEKKSDKKIFPFVFPGGRAKATLVFNYLLVIICIIAIVFGVMEIGLLTDLLEGKYISDAQVNLNDQRVFVVTVVQIGIAILAFITFLFWYHRSYKNIGAMGHEPKTTPGWAVGDFFIPFINLFEPYKRMKEIWIVSIGDKSTRLILLWWLISLAGAAIGKFGSNFFKEDATVEEFIVGDYLFVVSDVFYAAAAALTIVLINKITEGQENFKMKKIQRGELKMG